MNRTERQGWIQQGSFFRLAGVVIVAAVAAGDAPLFADGFHNAALSTKSLDEWLSNVKQSVPDLKVGSGSTEMKLGDLNSLRNAASQAGPSGSPSGPLRSGRVEGQRNAQQQQLVARQINDCLDILAYMDTGNILPHEFPNFPMEMIPRYRQAAKEILASVGGDAAQQVAEKVRQELMRSGSPRGMSLHANYRDDLIELLTTGVATGQLSQEEIRGLRDLAQSAASTDRKEFADRVLQALSPDSLDIETLVGLASGPLAADFKQEVMNALRKRIHEADVLDLFKAWGATTDTGIQRMVRAELSGRSPSYGDLKDDLDEIWQMSGAQDRRLAEAARNQVAVAFQRAPIAHCLYWLGKADPQLAALIWEQIDARIKRADPARKASYAKTGAQVLNHPDFNLASRQAAIDLLARLKAPGSPRAVADGLLRLPRELWVPTGKLLRDLTGQDYGPHEGDAFADVLESSKQWLKWSREHGE